MYFTFAFCVCLNGSDDRFIAWNGLFGGTDGDHAFLCLCFAGGVDLHGICLFPDAGSAVDQLSGDLGTQYHRDRDTADLFIPQGKEYLFENHPHSGGQIIKNR